MLGGRKGTIMVKMAKMAMCSGMVVPRVLYGSDTCKINAGLRKKVDVFEMSCLRPIRGVTLQDKYRNENIGTGCGLKHKWRKRVNLSVMITSY